YPALHWVAFVVIVGVERQILTQLPLYLPADKVGDQYLVFERASLDAQLLVEHAAENACDFGNHRASRLVTSARSNDTGRLPGHRRHRPAPATLQAPAHVGSYVAPGPWAPGRCR